MSAQTIDPQVIADELATLHDEIAAKRLEIRSKRALLRDAGHAAEQEARESSSAALQEARELVAKREQEQELASETLRQLEARLNSGDDSVSAEHLSVASKAIQRSQMLASAAARALAKAERNYRVDASDSHLAHLAADILETVTDAPIIVCTRPELAPSVKPAIILSQRTPSEGFGTVDVSGDVSVLTVGDAAVDWRLAQLAFDDTGSDAQVSEAAIFFNRACWPLPILAHPSPGFVSNFGREFCEEFEDSVIYLRSVAGEVVGYNSHRVQTMVIGDALEASDGNAVGTATVMVSVSDLAPDRDYMTELVKKALNRFPTGGVTPMGRIDGYSVISVESDRYFEFDNTATYLGSPPMPWKVKLQVEATYEAMAVSN